METLHLLYETKYISSLHANKAISLTGDKSFDGNAILIHDSIKKRASLQLNLKCHSKLISYGYNQFILIKCFMFQKYPTIKTQFIAKDCIVLPKNENKILWIKKNIKLKGNNYKLLPNIHFRIRLATKPNKQAKDFEFIPTFKEIEDEIRKLSPQQIQLETKEYNEYLDKGNPYLVYETLQQKIANQLIEQKKKKRQTKTM